jgi:uncharacterized membrane protein YraQ (UPF0718 family)
MAVDLVRDWFTWGGQRSQRRAYVLGLGAFVLIAVIGLYIVKWNPYVNRAVVVAVSHSLGPSIISGSREVAAAPGPSLEAALGYAGSYFAAVWQAMLLGLLLAATIETLVPREWLRRVLGSHSFRTSALGGIFALPTMM